jgi:hypothetical protein
MTHPAHALSEKLTVIPAFEATGDELIARGGTLDQYTSAIANGLKITMMYGDRDFICNCKLLDFHNKIISSMLVLINYKQGLVERMLV